MKTYKQKLLIRVNLQGGRDLSSSISAIHSLGLRVGQENGSKNISTDLKKLHAIYSYEISSKWLYPVATTHEKVLRISAHQYKYMYI